MLGPAMAGESFPGLAATARESVGQLLPDADPTKQRLAISSRQEALDIGSGKSKSSMLRYRDAAPLSEQDLSSATLLLRTSWQSRCRVMVVTSSIERQ